jgi:hypothetical protein
MRARLDPGITVLTGAPAGSNPVQASHVSLGGHGWTATGWTVVAAWTVTLAIPARAAYRRASEARPRRTTRRGEAGATRTFTETARRRAMRAGAAIVIDRSSLAGSSPLLPCGPTTRGTGRPDGQEQ